MIYCGCGCGQMRTKYAIEENKERKDRPIKYIVGHHTKGKNLSEEHKKKIGLSGKGKKLSESARKNISKAKLGDKNPMWKGDNVSYTGLHLWVSSRLPKSEFCEICNKKPPYDLANISGNYLRNLTDWQWLCRSCHMRSDGRLNNLIQYKRGEVGSCEI